MVLKDSIVADLITGERRMNLSFAGCGFLGIYHVGVATCFKEYVPHLIADKISGASAGALVACALITGVHLGEATSYTLQVASKARARALGPLHPSFNIVQILRDGLDGFLPHNAHEIASGRLHISLTRVSDRQSVLVNQFDSREDLIQALVCSSFVPFYCGLIPPKYKGVRYVDGGLSDNIPILDEHTISVSPFAGESDICPSDSSHNDVHIFLANTSIQFTLGNLYRASHAFFPPHPEILSHMCKQGFDDALAFLQRNDLVSCTRHLSIHSALMTQRPYHLDLGDDYEEDYDYYEDEHLTDENHDKETCMECRHRSHMSTISNLPPAVITALQAACDSVNSGMLTPLYNARVFKVISLLTAPWILPLDCMVVLAKRIFEWAPYMPSDMQWFVRELTTVIAEVIQFLRHGRHKYSARFQCQLAITEIDYNPHALFTPRNSPYASRAQTPAISRHISPSTSAHVSPYTTRRSSLDKTHPYWANVASRRRNVNVGFAVSFQSEKTKPIQCVEDLRHKVLNNAELKNRLIEHTRHHNTGTTSHEEIDIKVENDNIKVNIDEEDNFGENFCSNRYDEFSQTLQIADEMESILAYHYTDENNQIKFTEIYPVDHPHIAKLEPSVNDLAWDNFVDIKDDRSVDQSNSEMEMDLNQVCSQLEALSGHMRTGLHS